MSYRVLVDDNYHYMDESERWTQGEYATYADALAACERLVDKGVVVAAGVWSTRRPPESGQHARYAAAHRVSSAA